MYCGSRLFSDSLFRSGGENAREATHPKAAISRKSVYRPSTDILINAEIRIAAGLWKRTVDRIGIRFPRLAFPRSFRVIG
jgi:hypothetical protein